MAILSSGTDVRSCTIITTGLPNCYIIMFTFTCKATLCLIKVFKNLYEKCVHHKICLSI